MLVAILNSEITNKKCKICGTKKAEKRTLLNSLRVEATSRVSLYSTSAGNVCIERPEFFSTSHMSKNDVKGATSIAYEAASKFLQVSYG